MPSSLLTSLGGARPASAFGRSVRRPLCALALIASTTGAASLCFAQDAQPDAGTQPTATVTATATAPATTTVTTPTTTTPIATVSPVSDQEPYRLGRLIELEADRAKARRFGSAAFGLVLGGGEILTGALLFTIPSAGTDATVFDVLGVFSMVVGGLSALQELISLFATSPMERLFDQYAPVAIDSSLSASERVHRGEQMLQAMAAAEHGQRMIGAASSFIAATLVAGVAVFVGADNDLWTCDPTTTDCTALTLDRVIVTTGLAIAGVASVGDGLAKLFWERGAAEVAWEHWHASHEMVTVRTARLHFSPVFAPIRGGATAGFSLRF